MSSPQRIVNNIERELQKIHEDSQSLFDNVMLNAGVAYIPNDDTPEFVELDTLIEQLKAHLSTKLNACLDKLFGSIDWKQLMRDDDFVALKLAIKTNMDSLGTIACIETSLNIEANPVLFGYLMEGFRMRWPLALSRGSISPDEFECLSDVFLVWIMVSWRLEYRKHTAANSEWLQIFTYLFGDNQLGFLDLMRRLTAGLLRKAGIRIATRGVGGPGGPTGTGTGTGIGTGIGIGQYNNSQMFTSERMRVRSSGRRRVKRLSRRSMRTRSKRGKHSKRTKRSRRTRSKRIRRGRRA
jgi:hypothetical protein